MENEPEPIFFELDDITMHVKLAGPENGRPILFLHGFPEFWYGWKHQIPFFANRNNRLIIPDQRGYNLTDKPESMENYRVPTLVGDVLDLLDALEYESVDLVAHDWGAIVGWMLAERHPGRLNKTVLMNIPHPLVYRQHLGENWSQHLRSWYAYSFQLPWIPERITGLYKCFLFRSVLKLSSAPGTFSERDLERYVETWKRPGALRSMINWYRAAFQRPPELNKNPSIETPVKIIWGESDAFLDVEMAHKSARLVNNVELLTLPDTSHWLHHEDPGIVNREIKNYLS